MTKTTATAQTQKIRVLPYAIITAVILSIPLIAMQFSEEVQWTPLDFVAIGILLMGAGLGYEYSSRQLKSKNQKIIAAVITVLAVLYIWAELAVGIFTNLGS